MFPNSAATDLQKALQANDIESGRKVLEAIKAYEGPLNKKAEIFDILYQAVIYGKREFFLMLVEEGVSLNAKGNYPNPALTYLTGSEANKWLALARPIMSKQSRLPQWTSMRELCKTANSWVEQKQVALDSATAGVSRE